MQNDSEGINFGIFFLIGLRFPSRKSIAEIICKRYGSDTVKDLRKFEKLDY